MNINPISNKNNIMKLYNDNKKVTKNENVNKVKDSLEISDLGKSLSALSVDTPSAIDNAEKIEKIRMEINRGTYKVNPQLIAKNMMDTIKGREI